MTLPEAADDRYHRGGRLTTIKEMIECLEAVVPMPVRLVIDKVQR